ncbi:MAG: DNA polymerase IV [Oscillospiraceae bacterium]|nr:DNA polymerase IV [Oscillospiraceae bacterium]
MDRVILHADMNNFYASVECLYQPSLRGKPVAVSGDPEARHGIVLAKNDLAKRCGVTTGETLWQAKQKCPEIIFVPPHYDRYLEYSQIARQIYGEYSDQVEPFGLDESWIDVTGSTGLFGTGYSIANELRRRIRSELGVTISVGVSYNKIFAKLGSDLKKPDATTEIDREHFRDIVWPLPAEDLLCVGKATKEKLRSFGIRTIGSIAATPVKYMEGILGKNGRKLWLFANGYDTSPVAKIGEKTPIRSIGNSTTTPRDLVRDEDVKIILMALSESVSARLRDQNMICGTVQIGIRDDCLCTYERQGQLTYPNRTADSIFQKAYALYCRHRPSRPVRSLTVRACQLMPSGSEQLSFFQDVQQIQRMEVLETAVDRLRNRFGTASVRKGLMLCDNSLSSLDPKRDHVIHPVSFFH